MKGSSNAESIYKESKLFWSALRENYESMLDHDQSEILMVLIKKTALNQ